MNKEKQIDEMAKVIDEFTEPLSARDIHKAEFSEQFAEHLYEQGYRNPNEVIDEFATKLKDYPINVRLPLLGLETKEEIEAYVNNLFDQIEDIIDEIAKEMKGGEG